MFSRLCWSWLRQLFFRKGTPLTDGRRAAKRSGRRLAVEFLENRLAPAASLNQVFIASAYQELLGRPVDPTGLSYWSQQLSSGATAANVVSGILASTEYRTRELTQLYQTDLGRNPDPAGTSYWLQQLSAGTTWEQVEAGIDGSAEHYQYVGQAVPSYVSNLFQNTLGRQLDEVGSQYFLNLVNNAGVSRTAIASQVINSSEAQASEVTQDYQTILGRAPDGGLSYWTGQLAAGASRTTVLASIMGSPEYFNDLAAFIPSAPNDPNAAASEFLSNPNRSAASPKPPTLKISAPTGYVTTDPTITVTVTAGSGGMPTTVFIDVDLYNDGVFTDTNDGNRYEAPVINGVATVKLTNFVSGDNKLIRAHAVDAAGQEGVSEAFVVHTIQGDPINPAVPAQLASLSAADAVVVKTAKAQNHTTPGSQVNLPDPNNTFTEVEPNNTPGTANVVTLSSNDTTTIVGSISTGTDVDYYQFTLATQSGVFFDVNSIETGLSTTLDSTLTLYDSTGTNVIAANDNGYDFNTGWPLQASYADSNSADASLYQDLNPGTYYIEVASNSGTTGAYNLLVTPATNYSATPPPLSSLPGAPATLYLDFLGYSDPGGSDWNNATGNPGGGSPFTIAPYRFAGNSGLLTPGEQLAMQNIWQVVSEDYSPFDINVTTVDPGASAFTAGQAMRVVFGGDETDLPNDNLGNGAIGVGLEGSFASGPTNDLVCFVFADDPFFQTSDSSGTIEYVPLYLGNVASHEAGHTFDLHHYDILPNNLPIMEWQGPDTRATWWMGMTRDETATGGLAPFFQDDMAILSNATNGFGYRPDAYGSSIATATALTPTGTTYSASGVIDQPTVSQDYFSFSTDSTGNVTIDVNIDPYINDLNSQVTLYNSSGIEIANDNNPATYSATLTQSLPAGNYYVEVSSKGGNGEAGQYDLTINVPTVPPPPPPPPPPGGGGGGGSGGSSNPFQTIVSTSDIYAPNQTSDTAHDFGSLGTVTIFSYENLNIGSQPSGQYEWYKWEASAAGTFYSTLTATTGGPLEMHLFEVNNGILQQLNSNTGGTLSTSLAQGQAIYIEIKGEATSVSTKTTGTYNLDVALEPPI